MDLTQRYRYRLAQHNALGKVLDMKTAIASGPLDAKPEKVMFLWLENSSWSNWSINNSLSPVATVVSIALLALPDMEEWYNLNKIFKKSAHVLEGWWFSMAINTLAFKFTPTPQSSHSQLQCNIWDFSPWNYFANFEVSLEVSWKIAILKVPWNLLKTWIDEQNVYFNCQL